MGRRAIKKKRKSVNTLRSLAANIKAFFTIRPGRSKRAAHSAGKLGKRSKRYRKEPVARKPVRSEIPKARSKKPLKPQTGSRIAARRKRKLQWAQAILIGSSCMLVFLAISIFWKYLPEIPFFKEKSVIAKKRIIKSKIESLLFIGVKDENGQENAAGLALIIVGKEKDKIAGWSIPKDTFVVIPGRGYEKISVSLELGTSTTVATVQNFLGVKVNHFARLSMDDYEETVSKMKLESALESAEQVSLNRDEYARFSRRFDIVQPRDVNLIPLPVKPLMVGRETYLRPDDKEIDRLFDLIWDISEKDRRDEPRVIVLNGSGIPGAGGDAAERLIEMNCRVVETENANNFDYDKTQIIIYRENDELAGRIRKTLGAGVVLRKDMPQDLADVTVVIGKDYQPKTR